MSKLKLPRDLNPIGGLSPNNILYISQLHTQEYHPCPLCSRPQVVPKFNSFESQGAMGSKIYYCLNCQSEWVEVWQCTGYEIISVGDTK